MAAKRKSSSSARTASARALRHDSLMLWKSMAILLAVLLVLSVYLHFTTFRETSPLAANSFGRELQVLNTQMLNPRGYHIELVNVTQEHGMHKTILRLGEQQIVGYFTADKKLFFVNPVVIDAIADEVPKEYIIPSADTPEVKLFVMSFCPYCEQLEEQFIPAAKALQEVVNVQPHYVIYEDYLSGYPEYCLDEANQYCSLHGIDELKQNVRELCVYNYYQDLYWDYVAAVNAACDLRTIETCWKDPAVDLGINTDQIEQCLADEAFTLLEAEKRVAQQYEVKTAPSMFINNVEYMGARTTNAYMKTLCGVMNNPDEACAAVEASASYEPVASSSCGAY